MDFPKVPVRWSNLSSSKDTFNDTVEPEKLQFFQVPRQPLGIKPLGNQFFSSVNAKDFTGLFRKLDEELIAKILEILDANSLLFLGSTCIFLHAFCRWDNLWKTKFNEAQKSRGFAFIWLGTWRSTYLNLKNEVESYPSCDRVFSEILYRPYFCAQIPLEMYATTIPQINSISRLKGLSLAEYLKSWGHKPFILTHQMEEWPIFKSWNIKYLVKHYHKIKFRAESVKWRLDDYIAYTKNNCDESPLYLFDKNFFEKMNLKTDEKGPSSYSIPECFAEDLFTVLGNQRPDFRWLIIGPKRSGSSYHKDPNSTNAWNAVIRGSKYWIMFPSTNLLPSPPGVYVSGDKSEVTSPLSIAEWLLGFHAEARKTPGCIEGVCREGEILHVPSDWWHLVVNLETTIAITQNFVPRINLQKVLYFLDQKADQVSGFKKDIVSPFRIFTDRMMAVHPGLMHQASSHSWRYHSKKRKLESELASRDEAKKFTFSFFGIQDNEES